MRENKKVFIVTYRDNKNVKHMTFVQSFNSVQNLENQYGKITIQSLKSNKVAD